jgi:hypothetical protein
MLSITQKGAQMDGQMNTTDVEASDWLGLSWS